jgi:hypothetical protein
VLAAWPMTPISIWCTGGQVRGGRRGSVGLCHRPRPGWHRMGCTMGCRLDGNGDRCNSMRRVLRPGMSRCSCLSMIVAIISQGRERWAFASRRNSGWLRHHRSLLALGTAMCFPWTVPAGLRSSALLSTLVALEFPLLHKLLSFGADDPVVSIRKIAFLGVVDGPPLWAHIYAASDAHFVAGPLRVVGRRFPVDISVCRARRAVGGRCRRACASCGR